MARTVKRKQTEKSYGWYVAIIIDDFKHIRGEGMVLPIVRSNKYYIRGYHKMTNIQMPWKRVDEINSL